MTATGLACQGVISTDLSLWRGSQIRPAARYHLFSGTDPNSLACDDHLAFSQPPLRPLHWLYSQTKTCRSSHCSRNNIRDATSSSSAIQPATSTVLLVCEARLSSSRFAHDQQLPPRHGSKAIWRQATLHHTHCRCQRPHCCHADRHPGASSAAQFAANTLYHGGAGAAQEKTQNASSCVRQTCMACTRNATLLCQSAEAC